MNMQLTITINTGKNKAGKQTAKFFFVEFKKADMDKVLDAIENATLENVHTNPLWKVL